LRIVGVIPIRYRSTRFPGKALARIAGKPVLEHVYRRASACSSLDRLIVATDDRRIEKCALSIGAECFFSKTPHRCGSERVAEAVKGTKADIVVNIQGDEVLIRSRFITAAIRALTSGDDISCGTVCHPIESEEDFTNSDLVKVVLDRKRNALYFSRSPIPNMRVSATRHAPMLCHIGVYAFTRRALLRFARTRPTPLELSEGLEQLRLLESGMKIKASLTNLKNFSLNRHQDVPIVERMLQEERT
jgi:3-deoxy-manno-octulosonate cytidylyltransferase (CMP-KDO synthetase)